MVFSKHRRRGEETENGDKSQANFSHSSLNRQEEDHPYEEEKTKDAEENI